MSERTEHKDVASKYFDQRADVYEKTGWTRDRAFVKAILDHADLQGNEVALEVGVGTGLMAREVTPLVKEFYGLDVSKGMLEKAAKAVPREHLMLGDAEKLPFLDDSFEFVYCRSLVTHIPSPLGFYKEAFRVLKKGGKILVVEPGLNTREDSDFFLPLMNSKEPDHTHTNIPTMQGLLSQVKEAGFTNVSHAVYEQEFEINAWLEGSHVPDDLRKETLRLAGSARESVKKSMKYREEGEKKFFYVNWGIVKGFKE